MPTHDNVLTPTSDTFYSAETSLPLVIGLGTSLLMPVRSWCVAEETTVSGSATLLVLFKYTSSLDVKIKAAFV